MSKIASITVAGLQTTSKWVDHFTAECYSDAGLTNRVNLQSSGSSWDGTNSNQVDLIMFSGLTFGATYWIRVGVVAPTTQEVSWSNTFSIVATSGSAPGVAYTQAPGSPFYGPAGATVVLSPTSTPTDLDHFEAVWSFTGAVPAASTEPFWRGGFLPGTTTISLFVSVPVGLTSATLYVRAVSTSHQPQAWTAIGVFGPGSIDNAVDGVFGKVRANLLNNGNVDPRTTGFIKLGSINPTWSGSLNWGASTASDGSSWVTWTWTAFNIFLTDGTAISAVANTTGYTVSGLVATGVYYFYPWCDAFLSPTRVSFVPGSVGTDGVAHTTKDSLWDRLQNLQNQIALSAGAIVVTTPAAPSPGNPPNGGGGVGGGSACARFGQLVHEKTRGIVRIETVVTGEYLLGENGVWLLVKSAYPKKANEFIRITDHRGRVIEHDPTTEMKLEDGSIVPTHELRMRDLIVTRDGVGRITKIELVLEDDWKMVIELEAPHMFWCGTYAPDILAHNTLNRK